MKSDCYLPPLVIKRPGREGVLLTVVTVLFQFCHSFRVVLGFCGSCLLVRVKGYFLTHLLK